MKRILFCIGLLNIGFHLTNAQPVMTIRDIYDFSVNDEFHIKSLISPPNCTRIKITGKHFSLTNDTVFYTRTYNNYWSYVDNNPSPHLVYIFSSGIDSVFYPNLDSLISWYCNVWPVDSCNPFSDITYYSSEFCGIEAYEYNECTGCCFEGFYRNEIYRKGLGITYHNFSNPANFIYEEGKMIYFHKDTIECGIPDTTSPVYVSELLNVKKSISLSPNPASNEVRITGVSYTGSVEIFTPLGKEVYNSAGSSGSNAETINVSALSSGIYFVRVRTSAGVSTAKFVKQ